MVNQKMDKEMIKIMSEMSEKDLRKYLDEMIETAEWLVGDLKDYQIKLSNEEYIKHTKIEDIIRWAIDRVQHSNWHFDKGADVIGKYMYMKAKRGE